MTIIQMPAPDAARNALEADLDAMDEKLGFTADGDVWAWSQELELTVSKVDPRIKDIRKMFDYYARTQEDFTYGTPFEYEILLRKDTFSHHPFAAEGIWFYRWGTFRIQLENILDDLAKDDEKDLVELAARIITFFQTEGN